MNLSDNRFNSVLPKDFSHINIGTGYEISIRELAFLIAKIINYQGNIIFDELMPDGTKRKLLDNKRILSLGWKPNISLETGLVRDIRMVY